MFHVERLEEGVVSPFRVLDQGASVAHAMTRQRVNDGGRRGQSCLNRTRKSSVVSGSRSRCSSGCIVIWIVRNQRAHYRNARKGRVACEPRAVQKRTPRPKPCGVSFPACGDGSPTRVARAAVRTLRGSAFRPSRTIGAARIADTSGPPPRATRRLSLSGQPHRSKNQPASRSWRIAVTFLDREATSIPNPNPHGVRHWDRAFRPCN
jgi:hypothetical protein